MNNLASSPALQANSRFGAVFTTHYNSPYGFLSALATPEELSKSDVMAVCKKAKLKRACLLKSKHAESALAAGLVIPDLPFLLTGKQALEFKKRKHPESKIKLLKTWFKLPTAFKKASIEKTDINTALQLIG